MPPITADDVQDMVSHCLGCPPNGYLGSPYGVELKSLLQKPLTNTGADEVIRKLRTDVPILGVLGGNAVQIYQVATDIDKTKIVIGVGDFSVAADAQPRKLRGNYSLAQARSFTSNVIFAGFVDNAKPTPSQVVALNRVYQDSISGNYVCDADGAHARYLCLAFPYEYTLPAAFHIAGFQYQFPRFAMKLPVDGITFIYNVLTLPAATFATELTVETA